ncbi:MAG TPA: cyclic nucleotide-binding domain-containing protein [Thiotrichaceae bacterium]|nr:cyclic nucleotide-binding domain-containing protein [Thiotrichaceae bacterium]HIM08367.1 cyclic nucleotide-binding domain-containing protein [Gammaproteobacteria bacterium]
MSEANEQILQRIKQLIPINELTPNLQSKLLNSAQVLNVKKSRFLFKQGDKDEYSYFLLEGEVELHANKKLDSVLDISSDRAKYALAQLQPRQFSVKAKTEIKVLLIERNKLDQLMLLAQESTLSSTMSGGTDIEVDVVDGVDDDTDWMTQMLQSELFSRMSMPNIHQLFALLEPIDKKAGEVVISQGEPGEHYYIISEGKCAVSRKPMPTSKDVKLAELKTGDSFGEEALISDSTRNATITMITDGVLMKLSKDTFIELIQKPTLESLSFSDAEALVDEGAVWLDVRFPNEHQESSIDDSINIPLNSLRLKTDDLDSSKQYVLFCDTGGRSSTGAFLLAERGFTVSYLEGGLVNNPEALGVQAVVPEEPKKAPKPVEVKKEKEVEADIDVGVVNEAIDAHVRVEILNAKLETTQIEMSVAEDSKDEFEKENQKKLLAAKKKLEAQKTKAEAEAKEKEKEEELKFQKLKEEAKKKMLQEKKQLEEIYNKNAKDMEKLQKAKEQAEEEIRKEREKLEQQAEAAKKQIEEAERLKQEIEESKKGLEVQAEKKKLEDEARVKKIQDAAKAEIEEERKKLAEQYDRNAKEFEELKKEKAATEAVRIAAKEEADKIIREHKLSHEKTRADEVEKMKAERLALEEKSKKIESAMQQIQQAKQKAEEEKKVALSKAKDLKEKQMESTNTKEQRAQIDTEIEVVSKKVVQAERSLKDVNHQAKQAVSAKKLNEADLIKKAEEEKEFQVQVQNDLEEFEDKQQEEAETVTQVQVHSDQMKRIMAKAADAKIKAASANKNLMNDISKQLGD